jgi:hypothetical protein
MSDTAGGTGGPVHGDGRRADGGGGDPASATRAEAGTGGGSGSAVPRVSDWSGRPAWFIVNESAAFLVELAAFAALCWWGLHEGGVLLAVVTPLAAVVVWGLFAAPRARFRLPLAAVLVVKAVILGAGAVALWPVGHPVWAIVLGVVVLVNTGLAQAGRSRPAGPAA